MCGVVKLQVHGLSTHKLVHKKVLRIQRAIIDLTCGALEMPLVVIGLGVTGPKKTEFVCLLDFYFESSIIPILL